MVGGGTPWTHNVSIIAGQQGSIYSPVKDSSCLAGIYAWLTEWNSTAYVVLGGWRRKQYLRTIVLSGTSRYRDVFSWYVEEGLTACP